MDTTDLATFIAANGIEAEIVHLPVETLTVAAAAEAVHVKPEQIIKSVLFVADGRPVLVVANGLARIHRKRLADELGMSRRRVKMANADQVLAITGYEVGAVPPFGHPHPLPALIDQEVMKETAVYGGGGASNALMYLSTVELLRVIQGRIAAVADRS
ncbi:MAG: YbaK/EbsC family protein [Candidatus Promineifilaceae bacterium]|nr:YbaK/EbsC family protein [Candidatus Promineifilaceae bacterium]